ncbi:hypothetical protein FE257_008474 [Aspergillus nanangensis]|uniref:Uncharacterized protein n=1 Tax=Aspergillus nanangensis TaxID=2582783 RepID=A0AAD4CML6_ASPNN|nr:hypothetical protein FE257_008474 [Aspergillus nanangensis]
MQSPAFNLEYAQSIPALKDQMGSVRGDPVKVLDLLFTKKEYDFGSGAWFLTSQCNRGARTALQSGSEEGWAQFISSCVGTDANKERKAYWRAAVEALQLHFQQAETGRPALPGLSDTAGAVNQVDWAMHVLSHVSYAPLSINVKATKIFQPPKSVHSPRLDDRRRGINMELLTQKA